MKFGGNTMPAPLRVLIADDEPAMWDLYTILLEHLFQGVAILTAGNGQDAWEQLQKRDPDLLIMDLNRPGMGGLETLRRLAEKGASYPVLVVSGCLPSLEKEARAAAGPLRVAFLPKPCQREELTRELLDLCRPTDHQLR